MWLRMLVSQAVKQAAQDQVRKLLNEPAGGGLPGDEPRPLDPESLRADALIVFGSAAEAAGWVDLQADVETWPTEQGTLHKSQMGAVSCLAWINRNSPPTFLEDLIAWARPRLVVLAGFAVGLDPDARRGSLVIGQQVAKSGSDELTSPLGFDESSGAGQGLVMGKLITVNAPPEPGEPRQRLATEHSALAADPDAYAYAEIADLFDAKPQIEKKAYCQLSASFINQGQTFAMEPLPHQAQFSVITDMLIDDFNGDDILDILSIGNNYETKVEMGNFDASLGLLMLGNRKANFQAIRSDESQFIANGNTRRIRKVSRPSGNIYLVSRNNDVLSVFQRTLNHN